MQHKLQSETGSATSFMPTYQRDPVARPAAKDGVIATAGRQQRHNCGAGSGESLLREAVGVGQDLLPLGEIRNDPLTQGARCNVSAAVP